MIRQILFLITYLFPLFLLGQNPCEVNCQDYEVNCTNPFALDEYYTHSDTFTLEESNYPVQLIRKPFDSLPDNTWIPINIASAGKLGEEIKGICIDIKLQVDSSTTKIFLHAPTKTGIEPIELKNTDNLQNTNQFCPNQFQGLTVGIVMSPTSDFNISHTIGDSIPENYGNTWYLQIEDNGVIESYIWQYGEISDVKIKVKSGFPTPFTTNECTLDSIELVSEEIIPLNCESIKYAAKIERKWKATDTFGNESTCTQTVQLISPKNFHVELPKDTLLQCGLLPEAVFPSISGSINFENNPLIDICNFSITYEDLVIYACGNGFRIIRTWTYGNNCSQNFKTYKQLIKVLDIQEPGILTNQIEIGTNFYTCDGTLTIHDLGIQDGCSGISEVKGYYNGPGSTYNPNGQLYIVNFSEDEIIVGLPIGETGIKFVVEDSCGNKLDTIVSIIVVDNTRPDISCKSPFQVEMADDSCKFIYVSDIEKGSLDNCTAIDLKIRVKGDSIWQDSILFCCGENIRYEIELKGTDDFNNEKIRRTFIYLSCDDNIQLDIICEDYELNCNHPNALVDNYESRHYHKLVEDESIPLFSALKNGDQGNTWIPMNISGVRLGEILKTNIEVLEFTGHPKLVVHPPASSGLSPIEITKFKSNDTYIKALLKEYFGKPGISMNSNKVDPEITYNYGKELPYLYGETWYFQFVDTTYSESVSNVNVILDFRVAIYFGFPDPQSPNFRDDITVISENIVSLNCESDKYSAKIEREWFVVDSIGYSFQCTQNIFLIPPDISDVVLPKDTTISCVGISSPESVLPSISGSPTFEEEEIVDGICDFVITYKDIIVLTCGNSFKIIRTWTYGNMCNQDFKTYRQLITVGDFQEPNIANKDIVLDLNQNSCKGTLTIDDLGIDDNCSGLKLVKGIHSGIGTNFNPNTQLYFVDFTIDEFLKDIPLGSKTEMKIIAKDSCENILDTMISIMVKDSILPKAVAKSLDVEMSVDTCKFILASDIGGGSSDNCSAVDLKIRIIGESVWQDSILLCCGSNMKFDIELQVEDEAQNKSTANTFVSLSCDTINSVDILPTNQFQLFQNTPNPFQNETQIKFYLPKNENVTLNIYDVSGEIIKTYEKDYISGYHEIKIDIALSAGVYYYQLVVNGYSNTKKMIVLE